MKQLSSQLPSLKKFRVIPQDTLFEGEGYRVKEGVCPVCYGKLKKNLKGDKWICRGKFRNKFYHRSKAFKVK